MEIPNPELKNSIYKVAEMQITSFYGGDKNGPMIQLSLDSSHIQLNKEQVRDLLNTLKDWL